MYLLFLCWVAVVTWRSVEFHDGVSQRAHTSCALLTTVILKCAVFSFYFLLNIRTNDSEDLV